MIAKELSSIVAELGWHASNLHLHLARASANLNTSQNWHRPVDKLREAPVSGDHLREYKHILDDLPESVFATRVRICNTEGGL